MPHRRLPNTVPAIIRTFKTAEQTYRLTAQTTDRAISASLFARIDSTTATSLAARFFREASDVDRALALQAPLSSKASQTGARLTMFISHFHQVMDMAILRGDFTSGSRAFYGRDISATTVPDLSSYQLVGEEAEKIIQGEAEREEAEGGVFQAMSNPSAAAIETLWQQFKQFRGDSQIAQTATDREREELQALYPEAYQLAVDICDDVEYFYRKDPDPSSRRVKCTRWGVVYIYDTGEIPDAPPAAVPAPAAAGTNPTPPNT